MVVMIKPDSKLESKVRRLQLHNYTDRNFVDNFLKVVIYLALVANI